MVGVDKRLKEHQQEIPVRVHRLFDELNPLLLQQKEVEIFTLLIVFVQNVDKIPARALCSLLALVEGDALNHLEHDAVANIAAFVRDSMQGDVAQWLLQELENDND